MNIGCSIFASHRGFGYATRAIALLLRYLDESTTFDMATLLIEPGNVASLSVAARSGFMPGGDIGGSRCFKRTVRDEDDR